MTVKKLYEQPITTYQGGTGYALSTKEKVVNMLCTGLIGNTLYTTEADIIRDSKDIYRCAAQTDPAFLAKAAVYARNECGMKLQPVLALVYLSIYNKPLFAKVFDKVVKNPKDLNDFVNLCRKAGIRQGLGRTVKQAINSWLNTNVNEYNACRYRGKLYEVLKVAHPNPAGPDVSDRFTYIATGTPTFERASALNGVLESLRNGKVDAAVLYTIERHGLQLEELKHQFGTISEVDRMNVFNAIIPKLSYMALVQNLATIERTFGLNIGSIENQVAMRVANYELYKKSRMLPFKIISARDMITNRPIQRALESILRQGSRFEGVKDVMVNVDVSGSMDGNDVTPSLTAAQIASVFGAMIAMSDDSNKVYSVSGECHLVRRDTDELMQFAKSIESSQCHGGTRFETIARQYAGQKHTLIITDNEQCDNLESRWDRSKTLIIWQLTATHTKISKNPNVIYVHGFNDNLVKAIVQIMSGGNTQLQDIEKVEL